MSELFQQQAPGAVPLSSLPGRSKQIKLLKSLFGNASHMTAPAIFLYGHSSCGKSLVLRYVLDELKVSIFCTLCCTSALDVLVQ